MRTLRLSLCAAALAALALPCRPAAAQDEDLGDWARNCERWNRSSDRENFCQEREERIAVPRLLRVDGHENGAVSVRGWDRDEVLVRERIQAWGPSRDDARRIAGAVRVHTAGGEIYSEGPDNGRGRGYAVSYIIYVPRRMDLRVNTSNGPLAVYGVTGRMDLRAHNGPVELSALGGDVRARAENGPLAVHLTGSRWNGEGLDAETTNGPVDLSVPDGYRATLTTGTVNGPMNVDMPLTVQGRFPRQFTTQLGGGGAPVRVVTTNGPFVIHRGR